MKEKTKRIFQLLLVCGFALFLGLLGVGSAVLSARQIREKTALLLAQEQGEAPLAAAADAFEQAFNEELRGRSYLAGLGCNFFYFASGDIVSRQVFAGPDGTLFYKTVTDGDPMADYLGAARFSPQLAGEASRRVEALRASLEARGIRLAVLLAPNKETALGASLVGVPQQSDESRTDLLARQLQSDTGAAVLWLKPELRRLAEAGLPVYYRYDTHWTGLGAYTAYAALLPQLCGQTLPAADAVRYESAPLGGYDAVSEDLAKLIGMRWRFGDDLLRTPQGYAPISQEDLLPLCSGENPDAAYPLRVLLIGDSFRCALSPYLRQDFSAFLTVHRDSFTPELLENFRPDVVVLEYAERYSGQLASLPLF